MSDTDILDLLHELQSQLAFQEDTITSLNDALARQQRELILFRRQLELLKQQQDEQAEKLEELPGGPPAGERPPHY